MHCAYVHCTCKSSVFSLNKCLNKIKNQIIKFILSLKSLQKLSRFDRFKAF